MNAVKCSPIRRAPWHTGCFAKFARTMLQKPSRFSLPGGWWVALLALPALACQSPEPAPAAPIEPKPAPSSANAIPAGNLGGEIAGEPFSVQSARYIVDRRHGFEKVDISLSAGSVESPCEDRTPKDAPSVWLRRKGDPTLREQITRIEPNDEDAAWEVHYQVRKGHNWTGNGRASALIVVHDVGPDMKLSGELSACFGDSHGSCVAGRFSADYCATRIDAPVRGTEAMERPPSMDAGAKQQPGDAGLTGDAAR
jgi:hypothetical protein